MHVVFDLDFERDGGAAVFGKAPLDLEGEGLVARNDAGHFLLDSAIFRVIDGSVGILVGAIINKCVDAHGELERFRAGIHGAVGISYGELRDHNGFDVSRGFWMSFRVVKPDVLRLGALDDAIQARGVIGVDVSVRHSRLGVVLVSNRIEYRPVIPRNAGGQESEDGK